MEHVPHVGMDGNELLTMYTVYMDQPFLGLDRP